MVWGELASLIGLNKRNAELDVATAYSLVTNRLLECLICYIERREQDERNFPQVWRRSKHADDPDRVPCVGILSNPAARLLVQQLWVYKHVISSTFLSFMRFMYYLAALESNRKYVMFLPMHTLYWILDCSFSVLLVDKEWLLCSFLVSGRGQPIPQETQASLSSFRGDETRTPGERVCGREV